MNKTKTTPLLKIENVSKIFQDGTQSLKNINFEIYKNDFILIAGANGSGKTVLMNTIAKLENQTEGKIINNAKEFNLNEHIGIIFQDAESQILGETPEEDIAFGLKNLNLKKDEIKKITNEVLSFCELEHKKNSPARFMSGGEKRRLAIASILALNCDIIILDEPFANLDWKGVKLVTSILKKLKEENKTIIILTHEIEKILALTNRLIIINNGNLVFDNTTENAIKMTKSQWEEFELHYPFSSYNSIEDLVW